jgi:AcrR family transcriptional regulator
MSAPPTEPATRKDAVRNRELLVVAAVSAFREHGLAVSVNAIAEQAGVNIATLYRHFPTKDHLIDAVFDAVLEPLAAARDHALAADDAGEALATFFREAVLVQAHHRGLANALGRHGDDDDVRERLREPAINIVAPLVERAHRDGELRRELSEIDLLIALRMLSPVADVAQRGYDGADRLVDVVLRGLRPDGGGDAAEAGRGGPVS